MICFFPYTFFLIVTPKCSISFSRWQDYHFPTFVTSLCFQDILLWSLQYVLFPFPIDKITTFSTHPFIQSCQLSTFFRLTSQLIQCFHDFSLGMLCSLLYDLRIRKKKITLQQQQKRRWKEKLSLYKIHRQTHTCPYVNTVCLLLFLWVFFFKIQRVHHIISAARPFQCNKIISRGLF